MAAPTIESAFEAALSGGKIKGAILCAYDTSDSFIYECALGERTLLSGETRPLQFNDILCLASISKLFTTIALLQCVQDGLVTLTEDISHLIPELAVNQVLPDGPGSDGGDSGSHLEPATAPITLQMLLTHTHGQPYHFLVPRIAEWKAKHSSQSTTSTTDTAGGSGIPAFFSYPLAFQPSTSWLYGTGHDWASLLLQRLTHAHAHEGTEKRGRGRGLGEHVRQRICIPLQIPPQDAQFYPVRGEEARSRLVNLTPDDPDAVGRAVFGGNMENPNRLAANLQSTLQDTTTTTENIEIANNAEHAENTKGVNVEGEGNFDFGGHGLFSTPSAVSAILRSLLRNDEQILNKKMVEAMFRDYISRSEAETNFFSLMNSPAGMFFRMGVNSNVKVGYGLGALLTLEDSPEEYGYGKGTLTWGGAASMIWFVDRKKGVCGFVAIQLVPALPVDMALLTELKGVFRSDVYRKFAAWKEGRGERVS